MNDNGYAWYAANHLLLEIGIPVFFIACLTVGIAIGILLHRRECK